MWNTGAFAAFVCEISAHFCEKSISSGEIDTPRLFGKFHHQLCHTLAANLQSSGNSSSSVGGNIHTCSRPISRNGVFWAPLPKSPHSAPQYPRSLMRQANMRTFSFK